MRSKKVGPTADVSAVGGVVEKNGDGNWTSQVTVTNGDTVRVSRQIELFLRQREGKNKIDVVSREGGSVVGGGFPTAEAADAWIKETYGSVATLKPSLAEWLENVDRLKRSDFMKQALSTVPKRSFPWGVVELVGTDHSILANSHVTAGAGGGVWFRTRREAEGYGSRTHSAYVVARAHFPRKGNASTN